MTHNSQPSHPSLQAQESSPFPNPLFHPPQFSSYQQQWTLPQLPTQCPQVIFSQGNYSQPQESYGGTFTELLSSHNPQVSSEGNIEVEATSPPSSNPINKRRKRVQKDNGCQSTIKNRQWTPEESEALAKAWVSVSEDSIVGIEQANCTLWDRIFCAFNAHLNGANKDRNPNALACHWNTIQRECSKFEGYYDRCRRQQRSGANFQNDVELAKEIYKSEEKSNFRWEKLWWNILINEPKWNAKMLTLQKSTKRSLPTVPTSKHNMPFDTDGSPIQVDDEEPNETDQKQGETISRPIGRKRAKERRNNAAEGGTGTELVEYLSKIQTTMETQTLFAQEFAKGELEVKKQALEAKKQAMEDKRKSEVLKDEERVMMLDWSKLPLELQEDWKDRQNVIRAKWMDEGRLTRKD